MRSQGFVNRVVNGQEALFTNKAVHGGVFMAKYYFCTRNLPVQLNRKNLRRMCTASGKV